MSEVFIFGTQHINPQYNYVFQKLTEINPDTSP